MKQRTEQRRPSLAAGRDIPPGDMPVVPRRTQLRHLSIEHAAIAIELTPREMDVVTQLGTGASNSQLSRRLGISPLTGAGYIRDLKHKLRMSRLELAVLGYQLQGQVDDGTELPTAA
jgi:DNA-binding CsgD family transcriptional regulator